MTKYPIDSPDDLWVDFKGTVSKNETINDKLLRMIEEEVDKNES